MVSESEVSSSLSIEEIVLILIVLEDGLGDFAEKLTDNELDVLILIVLEDGLGVKKG